MSQSISRYLAKSCPRVSKIGPVDFCDIPRLVSEIAEQIRNSTIVIEVQNPLFALWDGTHAALEILCKSFDVYYLPKRGDLSIKEQWQLLRRIDPQLTHAETYHILEAGARGEIYLFPQTREFVSVRELLEKKLRRRSGIHRAYFLHIPKTGGQSLSLTIGLNHRGGSCLQLIGHRPSLDQFYWAPPDAKRRYEVVMGHFNNGIERGAEPVHKFTWLRDPTARMLSWYSEQKSIRTSEDYRRIKEGLTLSEWLAEQARDYWKSNTQCKMLAGFGVDGAGRVDEAEVLDVARSRLAAMRAFGLAERFDETLLIFAREMRWKTIVNVRANASATLPSVTPEVEALLAPLVAKDRELLAFARSAFEDRVRAEGSVFQDAVQAFRDWSKLVGSVEASLSRHALGAPMPREIEHFGATPLPAEVRRYIEG